jgi:hypothetical protein
MVYPTADLEVSISMATYIVGCVKLYNAAKNTLKYSQNQVGMSTITSGSLELCTRTSMK